MWQWSRPESIGNPFLTCWRDSSRSSWRMLNTSKLCLATRPTSKTLNGSRISCSMVGSRPSFIPPAPPRPFRELPRYRSTLVAERARLVNRVHKLLEDTNLKLTAVVTDVTGVSARAMLAALLTGETDPETLALLARGKLRKKREQLAQALQGHLQPHHRFLLTTQ